MIRARGSASSRGFTLVELTTVIGILAIVAAAATPSFRSFIGTVSAKGVSFELIGDMTFARSEAVKRNANTTMAPIGGDWRQGWRIVATGETLRERGALPRSISLAGDAGVLVFRPNGRIGLESASGNQVWAVESSVPGVSKRCVVLTLTGTARSAVGGC